MLHASLVESRSVRWPSANDATRRDEQPNERNEADVTHFVRRTYENGRTSARQISTHAAQGHTLLLLFATPPILDSHTPGRGPRSSVSQQASRSHMTLKKKINTTKLPSLFFQASAHMLLSCCCCLRGLESSSILSFARCPGK